MQPAPHSEPDPSYTEVVRVYERELFRLIQAEVGDAETAEDLMQESFVAAYREYELRPKEVELRTWLCGYARRQVERHFRSAHRSAPPEGEALE